MAESITPNLMIAPGVSPAPVAPGLIRRWPVLVVAVGAVLAVAAVRLGIWSVPAMHDPRQAHVHVAAGATLAPASSVVAVPAVEPQTFEQLSADEAEARNAARPLARRPLEPARPFVLPAVAANPLEWNRAVNCLALANYYEAASEGPAGMRAVSQVVLNRVRHPAFPKSVCEVVFQGSDRATGCQFTFTCDGSLARPAVPGLFARARAIAQAALQGAVERNVGMATHYHTRQVVPYWADSLDKIRVVGAHIFYVWRGGAGNRGAFTGQYAGEGSAVADAYLPADQRVTPEGKGPALAQQEFQQSARQLEASAAGGSTARRTYLVADEPTSRLRADEDGMGKLPARPLLSLGGNRLAADDR